MSPRTVPGERDLPRPTRRECKNPTGAIGQIWLVWKPTIPSYRRILAASSFLAEWSPRFALLCCSNAAAYLPRHAGCLPHLSYTDPTRSAVLQLLRSADNSTTPRFARNLCCCYELTSGFRTRGLTKGSSERYTAVLRGRSRRASLIQSPNDPLTRLSPEILESAV